MTATAYVEASGTVRTGKWSPEEDAILRENYQKIGAARTAVVLGRTLHSVHRRAQNLKIYTHARWTPKDDRRLSLLWGEFPLAKISEEMHRTPAALYQRSKEIGLTRGIQPDVEHITSAADRTGFSREALRGVLRWAHVYARRPMTRTQGAGSRLLGYDPADVDDAVADWMAAEYVDEAARGMGIHGSTLARWLEEAGERRPARKRRWRVSKETIGRVVADRNRFETVMAAARRVGINRFRLSILLRQAGVERGKRKTWYVEPEVVDQIVAAIPPRLRSYIERGKTGRAKGAAA
ncbi:MAG TPA: hypothetical protein VHG72_21750 [Polyangia bacterium]|nr:hypothetical protein [Polyangia bacterium]